MSREPEVGWCSGTRAAKAGRMRGKGGAEVITSQIFWVLQAPLQSLDLS